MLTRCNYRHSPQTFSQNWQIQIFGLGSLQAAVHLVLVYPCPGSLVTQGPHEPTQRTHGLPPRDLQRPSARRREIQRYVPDAAVSPASQSIIFLAQVNHKVQSKN